jgi:hypothetical protein
VADRTYKARRGFHTSGRDYSAGEVFPADGHDVPDTDIDVLVSRKMIAEASTPQEQSRGTDAALRQENEALKQRVAALEAQLVSAEPSEPSEPETDTAPRRRGRPPKARRTDDGTVYMESGDAEE